LKITIITPVFNGARYLLACIENVADNWVEGVEHLVIDGGSQDGSVEILTEAGNRYPHLRWISEKDNGQSDAMNKGIKLAKGNWIGFLNVDDFYEPGALNRISQLILNEKYKESILVGNLKIWNADGTLRNINRPSDMTLPAMLADTCEWPYNPAAYFYPGSVHERIGHFPENEHFAMDYDFILKAMVNHIPFYYFDEIWGNFRLLPEAKTSRDQADNQSYLRSQALRDFYFEKLNEVEKWQVRLQKLRWYLTLKWRRIFPKTIE